MSPISTVLRNHKLLSTLGVCGAAGGLMLCKERNRILAYDFLRGSTRTIDFTFTIGTLLLKYKYSFRNVEEGTPEYAEVSHRVNKAAAEKALGLFKRLGGYSMKMGQMASTVDAGLPPEWMEILAQCQDKATPVSFSQVVRVLEEDLGMKMEDVFREIDDQPVGCASLAQVHRGVLHSGEEVAVKIQYPSIKKLTQIDFRNIQISMRVIKRIFPSFSFAALVERLMENVENELDFSTEVSNLQLCRDFFEPYPSIYIPKVFPEFSSDRMVIMEYIHGIKVNDIPTLRKHGIHPSDVISLCMESFSRMIFQAGFLHVDPHPGNLMVRPITHANGLVTPQLVILDHGMYNHAPEGFNTYMSELWLAMISQDRARVRELCSVYGLERYSQMLTMMFTGRTLNSQNKLGEEMTEETKEKIRKEMEKQMMHFDKEEMERRMDMMSELITNMPKEMVYIFRTMQIIRGVILQLGGNDNDRLNGMTAIAVEGKYGARENLSYFTKLKWKLYLWGLQFRLWFNDLYVEWVLRFVMKQKYSFELDPNALVD